MSPYQHLHGSEEGPVADWRELIAQMTAVIVSAHYAEYQRLWPRPLTRRVLEAVVDTRENPTDWGNIQELVSGAAEEAMALGAIVGAALVMTWPSDPSGFDDWLDHATARTALAIDEAGRTPGHLAVELRKRHGWGLRR